MISFFTKYLKRKVGGSAICRGAQVAEYIGGRLNPKDGYKEDVCIYVKRWPNEESPDQFPRRTYFDIIDSVITLKWLLSLPHVGAIAISKISLDYISRMLKRSDLVFIPHHHCNYLRENRINKEITTVGAIGNNLSFLYDYETARKAFSDINVEFIYELNCKNRQDVIDFYKKIDIQVVWRLMRSKSKYRNPLKLSNAGSFGIPTIAFPERAFVDEWSGHFVPAGTIDELILEIKKLKNSKDYYVEMSSKALEKSEEYHIEKISKLYLELENAKT